jgi:CheY-like chemotaxis protein
MDWRMPVMDGEEATQRIREWYHCHTTVNLLGSIYYKWMNNNLAVCYRGPTQSFAAFFAAAERGMVRVLAIR